MTAPKIWNLCIYSLPPHQIEDLRVMVFDETSKLTAPLRQMEDHWHQHYILKRSQIKFRLKEKP